MSQEQAFLANLGLVASYEIAGTQLTLFDASRRGRLDLRGAGTHPADRHALAGDRLQQRPRRRDQPGHRHARSPRRLAEDGTLSGSAGCNNYTATYTVDGDQISITPVATTMMMCAEPEGVMEQEAEYIAALGTAATFAIEGDQLELRTADGALVASFVAAAPETAAAGRRCRDHGNPEQPGLQQHRCVYRHRPVGQWRLHHHGRA